MSNSYTQLYNRLKSALVEKDVEGIYREIFKIAFPDADITSPYNTDGLIKSKVHNLIALLEFKMDLDFKKRSDIARVLCQVVFYLKKFETEGETVPSIVFVGDINECFVMHTEFLLPYFNEDINWSGPPSSAHEDNPNLRKLLHENKDITPHVFDVDESFDFSEIVNKMLDMNKGIVRLVRITEKNIHAIFTLFNDRVMRKNDLSVNQLVSLFINIIINANENYIHPKKKNTLMSESLGEVTVNGDQFRSFFKYFEHEYSPREKAYLGSISDRLIEDETRRRQGAFFTPTEWVDEAHRMIEAELGDDWKEEYVVWDCACGTGNLTRDYRFKELYCSTLRPGELDIMIQGKVNPEATKFQYDFLSELDVPDQIRSVFKDNKPIVIFINPPYGRAGNMKQNEGDSKMTGIAETSINALMKKDKISGSAQLYTQFLYKIIKLKEIYNLNNIIIAIYTNPAFLTAESFKGFRKSLFNDFEYTAGMLFQASHFADVSGTWGIMFSLWHSGKENNNRFYVKIKDMFEENGSIDIKTTALKQLYNLDGIVLAGDWIGKTTDQKIDVVPFSSALNIKHLVTVQLTDKHLGCFMNKMNNCYVNGMYVGLFSSGYGDKGTRSHSVTLENFNRVVALFTARRSIKSDWINQKDEYMVPNTEHLDYEQWNNDALIYSLFNTASSQASLRDIEYKDTTWNIENEWFWLSNNYMQTLSDENNNDDVFADSRQFNRERFVYGKIQNRIQSEDARAVLDKATDILRQTFGYREMLNEEHPEYHLNTWDAGWYQIKKLANEYAKKELKEFNEMYRSFEDRMREGVYKFGFLYPTIEKEITNE